MIRSIGAVLGGFVAMAVVVMIGTMAATAAFLPGGLGAMQSGAPEGGVSSRYLAANLTISLLAAVLGGFLTARIAGGHAIAHAAALAGFILLMSMVSARGDSAGQPSWYPRTIAVVGVIGVLIGGVLLAPR